MKDKYIDDCLDELGESERKNVERVIESNPSNKWWRSDDVVEIAKHQLFEKTLMVDFSTFHKGIEKLLGRPVYTHEFGINLDGLKDEANKAIALLDAGDSLETSEEYKQIKVIESINGLNSYAQSTCKTVIGVIR